jgi:hypothetical protein
MAMQDCARIYAAPSEEGSVRRGGTAGHAARIVGGRKGPDEMIEELARYWFVAAVFHAPQDLAAAVADLRARDLSNCSLLVLANRMLDGARELINRSGSVPVLAVTGKEIGAETQALPRELRALLDAMDASNQAERQDGADGTAPSQDGRAQVYGQLRQDVAGGALVLVANMANPEEQLLGARILLHANSDCVLTHEISARVA